MAETRRAQLSGDMPPWGPAPWGEIAADTLRTTPAPSRPATLRTWSQYPAIQLADLRTLGRRVTHIEWMACPHRWSPDETSIWLGAYYARLGDACPRGASIRLRREDLPHRQRLANAGISDAQIYAAGLRAALIRLDAGTDLARTAITP